MGLMIFLQAQIARELMIAAVIIHANITNFFPHMVGLATKQFWFDLCIKRVHI